MQKRVLILVVSFCTLIGFGQVSQSLSGTVFVDVNQNNYKDTDEVGLFNVLISNGKDVVKTDAKGHYKIAKIEGNTVFVIKPESYMFRLNKQKTVQFFVPFDTIQTVKTYDFALYPHQENKPTKSVLLGDTQVDVIDDVHHVGKLVTEELMDKEIDFIVPLGDLSFDNVSIFDPLSQTLGLIGVPIFYTIGNHDLNFTEKAFMDRDKSFEAIFGPSYYAFEYGKQLHIVLNNIYPLETKGYEGRLDAMQLTFLRNLIALEKEKFESVTVYMHIPLEEMKDKEELITLVKPFENVFVAAGHTHTQYHNYFERNNQKPIHQLVAGAVCGSWWQGPHDIDQIPFALMYDGTPKGYWELIFDHQQYDFKYKVSGAAHDKQMNITVPNTKEWDKSLNIFNDNFIYANVFAADETTQVDIRFDNGKWMAMRKYEDVAPEIQKLYHLQSLGKFSNESMAKFPKPTTISHHLWRIEKPVDLLPGAHSVRIKASANKINLDVHGNAVLWIDK
ncbi:calcineurin-like phosphoesterase family protein [Flavobacterium flavipallidum]|uniref:Calcineurin-like phosphoesterase family protein n=1 Tax=Flavobacterium flavipallidum TaxID=3139140 RepID=A0ABU9HQJ4_9FLAO